MNSTFELTRISNLLIPVSRAIPVEAAAEYSLLGIRLDGGGAFLREKKVGSQIAATTLFQVKKGDFIYSRLFAWRGAFGLIGEDLDGCFVSSEFPTFVPMKDKVDKNFLQYWFRLSTTLSQVESNCTGSTPLTRNRFKEQFFLALEIPLPPLTEQRRIMARIEEVASRIEEARGLRRESVEETNNLLFSEATAILNHSHWNKHSLGNLLSENSRNGLSERPKDNPPGIPILRISAVTSRQDAIVDEEDFKYIELAEERYLRYKIEPSDLLACRFNGNLHFVGRFALYRGFKGKTYVYPDKLIRFRIDPEKALPEFVRFALNSPIGRKSIESFCATTAGNIGISANDLKMVLIPLPPLSEQQRIVTYLDNLQAKVDALKQLQKETAAELDALLPSVLDKAFKGEL